MTEIDNNRWLNRDGTYFPGTNGEAASILETGVYYLETNPLTGQWWLERRRGGFEFPFKIYGNHQHIIERVVKTWEQTNTDIGVLMNGVKGTGKTVSAKQLANHMATVYGMPTIVFESYSSLLPILLDQLQQNVVFFFDEFEKKVPNDDNKPGPSSQQRLLSYISGLGNDANRHLFLFTSNSKKLDDNLINRPGRIRYIYEFGNLTQPEIKEIVDDLLRPDLRHMTDDVVGQAALLETVSMDTVKTLVQEVNIHERSPLDLCVALNLTMRSPSGYYVQILDPETLEVRETKHDWRVLPYDYERYASHIECNDKLNIDRLYKLYIGGPNFVAKVYCCHDMDPDAALVAFPCDIKHTWFYKELATVPYGMEALKSAASENYTTLEKKIIFPCSGGVPLELREAWPSILADKDELEYFLLNALRTGRDCPGYEHDKPEDNLPMFNLVKLLPDYSNSGPGGRTNLFSAANGVRFIDL